MMLYMSGMLFIGLSREHILLTGILGLPGAICVSAALRASLPGADEDVVL